MGRRASENWKDIGGSGQSGMQVFRILERDQLYRVVLEREKNIFKELKKLQGQGFGGDLEPWVRGPLIHVPKFSGNKRVSLGSVWMKSDGMSITS